MKTKATRWGGWLLSLGALLLWVLGGSAQGANLLERMKQQEIAQVLHLTVGQSKVLRTGFAITRISVADPEIADILLISEKEVYVNGLAPGVTNLSIWGKSRFTTATLTVEADVSLLKEKLHQILPKEKIGVEAAGDSVVLSGEVSGAMAQQTALALALPFAGGKKGKVVNMMHVGGVQQVMLEVRVAEISRNLLDRMGVNFNIIGPSGNFGVSQLNGLGAIAALARTLNPAIGPSQGASGALGTVFTQGLSSNLTAIAGFKGGGLLWNMFFDVLKQKNLGRILAEPNLVTTSGQEASFLAGGEYPIPVPSGTVGNAITIEYKKFGVQLTFTPTVLDDGKIAMRVNPTVSEIDPTLSIAYIPGSSATVPGLRVRQVSTHLEVKDGQTFAMAGLLQDVDANTVNKFPVLGEIPILGTLFRSSQWQRQETELVVMVTTHLAKPLAPGDHRLPTDKWVTPNDYEMYLLGLEQGRSKPEAARKAPMPAQALPAGFGPQKLE